MNPPSFASKMIASCGINCGVCKAHLRATNPCHGCNFAQLNRPKTRVRCPLRTCRERQGRFCFDCREFPCDRLRHLDKRYRTRYGMSEIENLEYIRDHGLKQFIARECERWISAKGILCVHDKQYYWPVAAAPK